MPDAVKEQSTGLPGLDTLLQGLVPGDNVVWQIDSIDDYRAFVEPFCQHAQSSQQHLTYFRFASHPPLLSDGENVEICRLYPEKGFEAFISSINERITENQEGGCYVFDTLSELALDCYSDRMLGNFFLLTCPYLNKMQAVAYFAVLRNYHSFHAADTISKTTQIFLDVYRYKDDLYVHPLKVSDRFSPTTYRLHLWENDRFVPVTRSVDASEIFTSVTKSGLESALYQIGVWNRIFVEADEALKAFNRGEGSQRKVNEMFHRLLRMAVTRDERLLRLAEKYFTLADLMRIRDRMIGTGFIGGKTVGMLLARKILNRAAPKWCEELEAHDSFYIGSEVFYTYIVFNDCWWIRKQQKQPDRFLDNIEEAQKRILEGQFPEYMVERFKAMLEYYGQYPIIVRSSSLLEDGFGNAFAGKYESIFCINQGTFEKRLEFFLNAIRRIYASSMSETALRYRAERGILDVDEQMALLVQRVSGAFHGDYYYPHLAGVGLSFNPYIWDNEIDPEAGAVRLVFGLGTRAVDRTDDDYTRLLALSNPELRPESHDESKRYMQRKVDVLDLNTMRMETRPFPDVVEKSPGLPVELFVSQEDLPKYLQRKGQVDHRSTAILDFDKISLQTHVLEDLKQVLHTLREAYEYPVDVEFTVNFTEPDKYKINLLQCRPFQAKGTKAAKHVAPSNVRLDQMILQSSGVVIGPSYVETINRIIYVVPAVYAGLPINQQYSVARLIGKLTRLMDKTQRRTTLLLGPGRWGTTMPSLGVPVSFAEISRVSILGEIVEMRNDLVPDVSLGTHFFNNLVECDILYFAIFPGKEGNTIDKDLLASGSNRLTEILPEAGKHVETVRVIDFPDPSIPHSVQFYADSLNRRVLCYLEGTAEVEKAPSSE